MANAIASGMLKNGTIFKNGSNDVAASCPKVDSHILEPFKSLGCRTMNCNKKLVSESDVIILVIFY